MRQLPHSRLHHIWHKAILSLICATPMLAALQTRGQIIWLIACVVLTTLIIVLKRLPFLPQKQFKNTEDKALIAIWGVLLIWSFASSAWSSDALYAYKTALMVTGTCILGAIALYATRMVKELWYEDELISKLTASLLIGLLTTLLQLTITPFRELIHPPLFAESALNRPSLTLTLLACPVIYLAVRRKENIRALLLMILLIGLQIYTASETARLALCVFILVLTLSHMTTKKITTRLTKAVMIIILSLPLLVIPLYEFIQSANISHPVWTGAVAARAEIWAGVAERIFERPLMGWGLESLRVMGPLNIPLHYADAAYNVHPHNAFLQIWVDLGVIGVLLVCGLLHLISVMIEQLPRTHQPVITATYMSVLASAAVSHGAWQQWWLALLFILSAMMNALLFGVQKIQGQHITDPAQPSQ